MRACDTGRLSMSRGCALILLCCIGTVVSNAVRIVCVDSTPIVHGISGLTAGQLQPQPQLQPQWQQQSYSSASASRPHSFAPTGVGGGGGGGAQAHGSGGGGFGLSLDDDDEDAMVLALERVEAAAHHSHADVHRQEAFSAVTHPPLQSNSFGSDPPLWKHEQQLQQEPQQQLQQEQEQQWAADERQFQEQQREHDDFDDPAAHPYDTSDSEADANDEEEQASVDADPTEQIAKLELQREIFGSTQQAAFPSLTAAGQQNNSAPWPHDAARNDLDLDLDAHGAADEQDDGAAESSSGDEDDQEGSAAESDAEDDELSEDGGDEDGAEESPEEEEAQAMDAVEPEIGGAQWDRQAPPQWQPAESLQPQPMELQTPPSPAPLAATAAIPSVQPAVAAVPAVPSPMRALPPRHTTPRTSNGVNRLTSYFSPLPPGPPTLALASVAPAPAARSPSPPTAAASSRPWSCGNPARPVTDLEHYVPPFLAAAYRSEMRIDSLYPWQAQCLSSGDGAPLHHNGNLVYSAPTSGGKTLVAELLLFRYQLCFNLFRSHGVLAQPQSQSAALPVAFRSLFIVPFNALVQEKARDLHQIVRAMYQNIQLVERASVANAAASAHSRRGGGGATAPSPSAALPDEDAPQIHVKAIEHVSELSSDSSVLIGVVTIEKAAMLLNMLIAEKRMHELGLVVIDVGWLAAGGVGAWACFAGTVGEIGTPQQHLCPHCLCSLMCVYLRVWSGMPHARRRQSRLLTRARTDQAALHSPPPRRSRSRPEPAPGDVGRAGAHS